MPQSRVRKWRSRGCDCSPVGLSSFVSAAPLVQPIRRSRSTLNETNRYSSIPVARLMPLISSVSSWVYSRRRNRRDSLLSHGKRDLGKASVMSWSKRPVMETRWLWYCLATWVYLFDGGRERSILKTGGTSPNCIACAMLGGSYCVNVSFKRALLLFICFGFKRCKAEASTECKNRWYQGSRAWTHDVA